jgi:hypothetical protein
MEGGETSRLEEDQQAYLDRTPGSLLEGDSSALLDRSQSANLDQDRRASVERGELSVALELIENFRQFVQ